jgi:hypothetical protein
MLPRPGLAPYSIDLTRFCHRSVTSFYSNLVTRPTGRAVRMGVESQLAELGGDRLPCLSVLDFSQVRVIDYSCADEIVAKLLLRYMEPARPAEVFFLVRGLVDHQEDAVEAVLERYGLLIAVDRGERHFNLLGPSDPFQRSCWSALLMRGTATVEDLAADMQLSTEVAESAAGSLVAKRVALGLPSGGFCAIPSLLQQ